MRELTLGELKSVSGCTGPVGATLGAVGGLAYYVTQQTVTGNDITPSGALSAIVGGAVTGSGLGVALKGVQVLSNISVKTIGSALAGSTAAGGAAGLAEKMVTNSEPYHKTQTKH